MPQPVTITKVIEETAVAPGGTTKAVLRVEFKVGDHGPFIERVDKASFNAAALQQTLTAFAQQLDLLGAK